MRKLLLLKLLVLYTILFANAQVVELQNPYPTSKTLHKVHFFEDKLTGLAVGDGSFVLRTTDGGITWEKQYIEDTHLISDLSFINDSVGFAVYVKGVYKTQDRGLNWQKLDFDDDANGLRLLTVFFLNENVGWVGGFNKHIFKTTDGGNSWLMQQSGSSPFDIPSCVIEISFKDSLNGMCGGNFGEWLITSDGGENWTTCRTSPNLFRSITYDNDKIFVTEQYSPDNPFWFHTSVDNGITWESSRLDYYDKATEARSLSIQGNHIWVAGNYGVAPRIYHSSDYGSSWEIQFIDTIFYELYSCYFTDTLNGWVVGEQGTIYNTQNGGNTWEKLTTDYKYIDFLRSIYFVDSLYGYAGGQGPYRLIKTEDGGETWKNIDSSLPYFDIHDVFFLNRNLGWICGDGDYIYKTINGGETWQQIEYDIPISSFEDIFFIDENQGWMCGSGSNVYKTLDGGLNWEKREFDNANDLAFCDIKIIDDDKLWLRSFMGQLYKTENGGISWNLVMDSISQVEFINDNIGWLYNYSSDLLYKTNDGGFTWDILEHTGKIPRFAFYDELTGVGFAGDSTYITKDGGQTWTSIAMDYPLEDQMYDIVFPSKNDAWICGMNSCIYHIDIDKQNAVPFIPSFSESIIYPNPTTDYINIINPEKYSQLDIYALNGRHIKTITNIENKISVSELKSGGYVLKLRTLENVLSTKIIKK